MSEKVTATMHEMILKELSTDRKAAGAAACSCRLREWSIQMNEARQESYDSRVMFDSAKVWCGKAACIDARTRDFLLA
jgi:hypothetical protein